ncbi:MAG: ABC transporter permease [Acidobacteria bacterium]|nr:MAG: ABC transporter permease [Acidobacteriota bacterium]PYV27867.1 MAG: ABC transporter permease [Acidobacteriota bacterium]
MQLAWKAWGFFKRDLMTDISYKLSFAFQVVDILVGIGTFYFLARILGRGAFRGYEPFAFILVGTAVNGYMTTSLTCFAQAIRGNQPLATLKAVLATPTSPIAFVLFSSLYPILRAAFDAGVYILGGVMFGMSLARVDVLAVTLLFFLSVLAFNSIGILSATFTLVFKRGDPLLWLFAGLSWLLGGVFYPVEVLPRFLRDAAQLLPITHALTGMRAALLHGASVRDLLPQIGLLALFGLVGLPLSLLAFHFGVRWAKVTGTLSHF